MRPVDRVWVFDTTLRDGEQSPGCSMTSAEKIEMAHALSRLGVDVIEAGFPSASPDDLAAVQAIAEDVGRTRPERRPASDPPVICALARAVKADIDAAWQGVKRAERPRIHTFLSTSPIHMEHKLRLPPDQVLERVSAMVAYAKSLCADVEFSAEDATRSELDFLVEVFTRAVRAGATTLNVPDTVGYTTPAEMTTLIRALRERVPGIDAAIISVHCHNDLGLATANTLAAIAAGARQCEVTINGIGERAGNAALEEVVMALDTRVDVMPYKTWIDTTQLVRASRLLSTTTGMSVQANKAIVGGNAFAHEAGIHQDGMLKNQTTYEIMRPESVGATQTSLVLGKHSGRHALGVRLAELGYTLSPAELARAFTQFKALADKKKKITDADLETLVATEVRQPHEVFALDGLLVGCGTQGMPTATVRLRGPDGKQHVRAAVGTGPVDAAFKAIDEIVATESRLLEFAVHAVTEGIDALGEVTVRVKGEDTGVHAQHGAHQSRIVHGHGADTDIIVASAKAYVAALNKLLADEPAMAPASSTRTPAASASEARTREA
jgi:2-isopropylmalate synthase